jgi:hypothetical protein
LALVGQQAPIKNFALTGCTPIILQKGDCPMLKIAVRYTRYALLVLTTVGFAGGGPLGTN